MRSSIKMKKAILTYVSIVFLLVIFLFPVYWLLISSFQTNGDIMKYPPHFFPEAFTLDNYLMLLGDSKYFMYAKNSAFVSIMTVVLCLVISVFAGYALSRFRFRGKAFLMSSILNVQIFPTTVIMISLFTFYSDLKLLDTYTGLIIANCVFTLPFAIWFLKSFFDTIPTSLDESARIDGCGWFHTIVLIVAPLIKPGMVAVSIYSFMKAWDDFMFALIIIKDSNKRTFPLGIAQSFIGEFSQNYAGMMAISVIASVPIVILFVLTQKQLISGLTAGSVKE